MIEADYGMQEAQTQDDNHNHCQIPADQCLPATIGHWLRRAQGDVSCYVPHFAFHPQTTSALLTVALQKWVLQSAKAHSEMSRYAERGNPSSEGK
jgi:hypothetical protein